MFRDSHFFSLFLIKFIFRWKCYCWKLASIYPATIWCKNCASWLLEAVWWICGKVCESVTNSSGWWITNDRERCTKRSDKIRNRTSMPLIVELNCNRIVDHFPILFSFIHSSSSSSFISVVCVLFVVVVVYFNFIFRMCFFHFSLLATANCANLFADHAASTRKRC